MKRPLAVLYRLMRDTYIPICDFIEGYVYDNDRKLYQLCEFHRQILTHVFTPDADGLLPFQTVIISSPKKTAKTFMAACIGAWFATCMSEDDGEIYVVANAHFHAKERAYRQICRIFERNLRLRSACKSILEKGIETEDGVQISPISTDAGSIAGANPELILTDELWAASAGADETLWSELVPVHTRKNSLRVVTSYAGVKGYSVILENLYKEAMKMDPAPGLEWITTTDGPVCREDRKSGIFCAWTHDRYHFPWCVTPRANQSYEHAHKTLTHSEFKRLHLNEWASNNFGLDMDSWDACVDPTYIPPEANQELDMVAAVDASYARDRTSVVSIFKRGGKFMLGPCATWQPIKGGPMLDLEETAEKFIFEKLHQKFRLGVVFYDPAHMVRAAQALTKRGVRMEKYNQTSGNLLLMAQSLMDKLRYRTLTMYRDEDLWKQASSTSVSETPDGMKLEKGRTNAKVDSIVALAMAIIAAERRLPDFDNIEQQIMIVSANRDEEWLEA